MKEVFIIITIKSKKIDIPLEDFYIGCAGDNLRSTRQFVLENIVHPDCIHRLYLTFTDGTTIDIGELMLGGNEEPEINNLFNAETASLNCRIGSSGSPSAYNGMVTTDYIPVDSTMNGKKFVIIGLTPVKSSAYNYYVRIGFYDENQAVISNTLMSYSEGYAGTVTAWDSDITSNNAYIRISIVVKDNVALTSDDIADLVITLE